MNFLITTKGIAKAAEYDELKITVNRLVSFNVVYKTFF